MLEVIEGSLPLENVDFGVLGKQKVWVDYTMKELHDNLKQLHERSHDILINDYQIDGEGIDHLRQSNFVCPLRQLALAAIKAEHDYRDWSI